MRRELYIGLVKMFTDQIKYPIILNNKTCLSTFKIIFEVIIRMFILYVRI